MGAPSLWCSAAAACQLAQVNGCICFHRNFLPVVPVWKAGTLVACLKKLLCNIPHNSMCIAGDVQPWCVGMSTFSTKGGLYERAQKRFNVSNGKRLFTYSFYEKRKLEALVRINFS